MAVPDLSAGHLRMVHDSYFELPSAGFLSGSEAWADFVGRFSAMLECDNGNCRESCSIGGEVAGEVGTYGEEVRRAFARYWGDPNGAVESLRRVVDRLFDHFRIPKSETLASGKERRFTWTKRLGSLSERVEAARGPMAVQALSFLGHEAVHEGEYTQPWALQAFEITEVALLALFRGEDRSLDALIDEILQRRGHPDAPAS